MSFRLDGDPEPGRPRRLPSDLQDAEGILAILLGSLRTEPTAPRSALNRVMREALWFLWEAPRLPRPLVASKYPATYPWSSSARERARGPRQNGGRGLVIEHLRPRRLLIGELFDRADQLDPQNLVDLLQRDITAAIITPADDQRLSAAGLGLKMPEGDDGTDPWSRYRAAGMVLSTFEPLKGAL